MNATSTTTTCDGTLTQPVVVLPMALMLAGCVLCFVYLAVVYRRIGAMKVVYLKQMAALSMTNDQMEEFSASLDGKGQLAVDTSVVDEEEAK
jgi:hypothetical protein